MTPERLEEIKKNVDLWLDDDDGSVLALIIALEGAWVEIEVLKESFGMAAMERVMADNHDLSEGIDGMIADREYFEKIAEQAEIDLAKMTANAEIERLGREEAAKAYEKAEAERDKLKGALDISEHRGLAYMEQRDKLAARVKELESAARAALEVLIVMYQHRPPTSIGAKVVPKLRAALRPTEEER